MTAPSDVPTERIIEHTLPTVGRVSIALYKFASSTFEILDTCGDIDRLKNINQLGPLRAIYPGAHHTRWDYISLHLYLLRMLRSYEQTLGLNTTVELDSDFAPTKLEILQSFIFLRHVGHFMSTFPGEGLFLELLNRNSKHSGLLIDGMPTNLLKGYAQKVLDEERIFELHRVLSVLLLTNKAKVNYEPIRLKIIKVIEFFLFDQRAADLRALHENTRRLAYIMLDLQFCAHPITINAAAILANPIRMALDLSEKAGIGLIPSINFLERQLQLSIYQSSDSLWVVKKFRAGYEHEFLRQTAPVKTVDDLVKVTLSLRKVKGTLQVRDNPLCLTVPGFSFRRSDDKMQPIKKELSLQNLSGLKALDLARTWDGERIYLYTTSSKGHDLETLMLGALRIVGKRFDDLKHEGLPRDFREQRLEREYGIVVENLMRSVIEWLTHRTYRILMDVESMKDVWCGQGLIARTAKEAKHLASRLHSSATQTVKDPDRLHEIAFLVDYVSKLKVCKYLVMFPGRIRVLRKSIYTTPEINVDIAEFDGALLIARRGRMRLLLFEAKNTNSGQATEGRRDLESKLFKLKLTDNKAGSVIEVQKWGAYYEVDFSEWVPVSEPKMKPSTVNK